MLRSRVVTTPAVSYGLTTKARARMAHLSLTTVADDILDSQIIDMSSKLASFVGVSYADDHTITLGYEEIEEEFRVYCDSRILLSRFPVISVTSFTIDGSEIDDALYTSRGPFGEVFFHFPDKLPYVRAGLVKVRYFAGWTLPGDPDFAAPVAPKRALPWAFEQAVFELLRAQQLDDSPSRDPALRSEASAEVDSFSYFAGGAMPQAIKTCYRNLNRFKRLEVV